MQIKDNGMTFHDEAPADLAAVLEQLYQSKERVRVFYGDRVTGRVWPEEYDVLGRIGRSTGSQKCPLLINNARSRGGPALLDYCILRIDTKARGTIYLDPVYREPCIAVVPSRTKGKWAVLQNDERHADNIDPRQKAENLAAFMSGKRWKK